LSELWLGDHTEQDHISIENSWSQSIDTTTDFHFNYSPNTSQKEKEIMLNALRYFTNPIIRDNIDRLRFYADYIYRKDKGYIFLDGSEGKFWTNTGR